MSELTEEKFIEHLREGFEDQARLINSAFQEQTDHFDKKLDGVEKSLREDITKVDERLQTVETKLDRALYTELVHLETRLRRVEEKVGIKTA